MPKLRKIESGLYHGLKPNQYVVRKYVTGRGELYESFEATSLSVAQNKKYRILAEWKQEQRFTSRRVSDVFDELIPIFRSKSKKTFEDFEAHMRLHIFPFYQDMDLTEVGPEWPRYVAYQRSQDAKRRLLATKEKPYRGDRKLKHDRKHLMRLLKYSVTQRYITAIPELPLDRADTIPAPGREFANAEIKRLLNAMTPKNRLKTELQLNTGMRRGEVRMLRKEYLNRDTGCFHLPKEIVKTRDEKVVPLDSDLLKKVLKHMRSHKSDWLFPNKADASRPESATDKSWQRAKARAGVRGKQHWLRHTAATRIVRSGVASGIAQKMLGMSDQVMKRVYLHAGEEDLKLMRSAVSNSMKGKR